MLEFLSREKAAVICLQEVYLADAKMFAEKLRLFYRFAPMVTVTKENPKKLSPRGKRGNAILTSTEPLESCELYYAGSRAEIPDYGGDHLKIAKVLLSVRVNMDGTDFTVGTTHLTWTPDGHATPQQVKDLESLFKALEKIGEGVFCGDFNAPRGRTVWAKLAEKYRDNIPPDVASTLDPQFHKNKTISYVVDGIFSTPGYDVNGVHVVGGLSDHKALVAQISRR